VAIDVDLVREVNDSLGHVAGDRVLVEVARRLSAAAGPHDVVARLHGDAFALLLADVPSADAAASRAAAVLTSLALPVRLGDVFVRVDATAGLAVAGSPGGRFAELLREADVARHQAKRGGPRVARYSAARDPADIDALALGGELPRAIEQREFTVCFQPIVDLASGTMIAAEALARWRHPDRGELDPRRFLAAVERSGLLPSFDEAVLDQALAALVRWRAAGVAAQVAVNASPRSLLDPEYPSLVDRQLARYGLHGADLVIELTESLTPDDLDLAAPSLARLRAIGVRLALDDFGTRASSLVLVARLPEVDLKIDRSFVDEMTASPASLAVVRSTVELGRSLGRLVVAEGIEREEQRRTLLAMGCSAGQGHLFGRPLPIDELMRALERGMDGVAGQLARPMT
jgi:diguanylate cyclase (GGDEF)-like protein